MSRDRWAVFGLLNASWITFGLLALGTVTGLSRLFFSRGMQGPSYDFPFVLLSFALAITVGLAGSALLFTRPLRQRRPDLIRWSLPPIWFFYVALNVLSELAEGFSPFTLTLPSTVTWAVLALLAGLIVSWVLSQPPRDTAIAKALPRSLAGTWWQRLPAWARGVCFVALGLSVGLLLHTAQDPLERVLAAREDVLRTTSREHVQSARLSPDGSVVAVTATGPGTQTRVILVDSRTKRRLWERDLEMSFAEPIWLSSGTRLLVAPRYKQEKGAVLDPSTGRTVEAVADIIASCRKAACVGRNRTVLPDGQRVILLHEYVQAAWLEDAAVQADRPLGARLVRPDAGGHTQATAITPDGRRAAVGYADGTVIVFEALSGKRLAEWRPHTDAVYDLAWSPDGSALATYGKGACGGLSNPYCVMVTNFSGGTPSTKAAWRHDGIDTSTTLEWVGRDRLLLDDDKSSVFTIKAPGT